MKIWMPSIETSTGAEAYVDQLAAGLREKCHQVIVDKIAQRFQYAPWFAGLKPPSDTDVVFANSWSAVAFAKKIPLVTVVHHVVHDPALSPHKSVAQKLFHKGFVKPMERAALRRSDKIVAVSHTTAKAIGAFLSDRPVTVVRNGVDTDFFSPLRCLPARSSEKLRLLFVGKRSRRKGFDLAVQIAKKNPTQAELVVIGGGSEVGLDVDGAQLRGRLDDEELRDVYRSSDFLLFPSRLEGYGLVAAEAMACGLPVLCLSGGAVEEVVSPPYGGFAVPAGQFLDLGAKALAVFSDREAHQRLRQSARNHAVRHHGRERWLKEMEHILYEAAAADAR